MARSINSDPLLSHHFSIIDVPVAATLPFAFPIKLAQSAIGSGNFVGAKSVTFPDVTLEMKQIKEGNNPYIHQVPMGFVTTGDVTIEWALFNINLDMWAWMQQAILGRIAPRRSLIVVQTRSDKIIPQRMTLLEYCVPSAWKPGTDLDAETSQVVMESLTLNVWRIQPIPTPIPVTPPNASWVPRPPGPAG